MVRMLRAVPVPLALIMTIGLAGVVLARVYAGPLLVQLVFGAAIGSVGVSVAARRLPSWLVAPVSILALAGYTAFALWLTARRADLTGDLGEVLADAARNGIPRLLTALIPVEPVPDTVIIPLVAAWLAGLAGAEVGLRAGRVLLGFLPPVLLFAAALYVVGPNADPATRPTLVLVAMIAAGLAASVRSAPTPAEVAGPGAADVALTPAVRAALRLRTAAATAAGLAVVVGLAVAIAPVVAGRVDGTPVDPRQYVQPPQVESLDENPLIRISGWALNPDQVLLDVDTTRPDAPAGGDTTGGDTGGDGEGGGQDGQDEGGQDGDGEDGDGAGPGTSAGVRIRLAILHDYDGVTWRVGATYRNAGRILPKVQPSTGSTVETIRQEITVAGLTGRLLPAVPTPQEVSGARVAYDQGSGTMIRPEGLTPGLTYTVTSRRENPDLNLLATANVPAGDEVARMLRIEEGVPDPMRRLADQLAAENGAPYARAAAIEQFLSEHYPLVADAPSGHAYPNLGFFLFGPRNGGGQRGTSEQFASAFAVLGRLMGLPTRVVVGFRSATGSGPVRAADAVAWPEVLFDELGWVAFDPLPRPDTKPRPVEEDFKPEPEKPPPPPDEATPSPEPAPTASADPVAARGRGPGTSVPVLAGGGSAALLLLLTGLAVALLWLRRGLSRRRLVEGAPARRIAGAWREVTDALRLAGHPVPDHLAATEVAAHARQTDGWTKPPSSPVPSIDELAELVNLAAFAPAATSADQASRAGEVAVAYAAALRAGRPRWRRLLWSLHPGPLRWRR